MITPAERARAWYYANREKAQVRMKAYRESHPGQAHALSLAWRTENRERARETRRRWREANPEAHRASQSKYAAAHPEKYRALRMKRIADEIQRTPAWADFQKIEKFYAEAKELSEFTEMLWHVDHVVPLRGKLVSGLHVHENLQLLPGVENVRKSNCFEPG